jgi:hypothetical protein
MILDDFVMLGKTVPETNSDGRSFVCTAGYSFELAQPVRVYPMARANCPPRWSMSRIPLERNPRDNRTESWKIRGNRSPGAHEHINAAIEITTTKINATMQRSIVDAMTVSSLRQANDERRSLCVLLPKNIPQLEFEPGDKAEMAPSPDLFGHGAEKPVMQRFPWHPRIRFADENGKHDLMLRDWGCYELMRKKGDQYTLLFLTEALNLMTSPPLLCGNLNRFRNSWLVISVFSGVIHARPEVANHQMLLSL